MVFRFELASDNAMSLIILALNGSATARPQKACAERHVHNKPVQPIDNFRQASVLTTSEGLVKFTF